MDIGASNWNESDGSNSAAAPDGAPEGMQPSGVNDTLRAIMGAVKRWFNWSIPKVTGGTSTAYTLTYGVGPGALVDGATHLVQFHAANGAGATLNVNLLGAKPLHYYVAGAWYQIPPGLLDVDMLVSVAYHAGTGAYRLVGFRNGTGKVEPFAGATPPAGSLLCYGQQISRTSYAGLFAVINTTYGVGDGSTTFNVPDLRSRVVAGRDDMGGVAAVRFDGTVPRSALGGAFGEQYHTLSVAEMPSHSHGLNDPSHSHIAPGARNVDYQAGSNGLFSYLDGATITPSTNPAFTGITVNNTGGSGAHNNVQPTFILNHIIAL